MIKLLQSDAHSIDIVTKVQDEVFCAPLLTTKFCEKLVVEIENFKQVTKDSGVALRVSQLKLDDCMKTLVNQYISPLLFRLYPKLKGTKFDVYPKLVEYFIFLMN